MWVLKIKLISMYVEKKQTYSNHTENMSYFYYYYYYYFNLCFSTSLSILQ